jgi:hypothetical protein
MKILLSALFCVSVMANENMKCEVVDYYTVKTCYKEHKTNKVVCKNVRTAECLKYSASAKDDKAPVAEHGYR